MKRLAYILAALVVLLPVLCGCGEAEREPGLVPVSFSTSLGATRVGGEQTADNMTSMGVFAYYTKGNIEVNAATATPNYMRNQQVTKDVDNDTWSYSPVMYWPANRDEKVSFFAYAPHSDEISANGDVISVPAVTDEGLPKFTYTNHTGQTDLLIAAPLTDKTSAESEVKFGFCHALTKVVIKVKSTDNTASKKVLKSLSVFASRQGILSYKATSASNFFAWSDFDVTQAEMLLPDANGKVLPATSAANAVTAGSFYLLPYGTGASFSISYEFYETVNNKETLTGSPTLRDISFTNTDSWLPGASVTYLLSINLHTITVTNVSWENMNLSVNTGSDKVGWETGETCEGEATEKTN